MNALIFGGDARQIEVGRILMERGIHVYMAGFDQAENELMGAQVIKNEDLSYESMDLFILPVSGVKKGGDVDAPFSTSPLFMTKEIAESLSEDCIIISGIATPALKNIVQRDVLYIFDREDAAILNSIPTAEGALMIAMQKTDHTIHGANVMVIGFGRVGTTTARLFHQVGARVTTAVRETGIFARAKEMNIYPFYMASLIDQIEYADVVINTVPALVLTEDILARMNPASIIIDLASEPGGTDFEAAEKAGIQVIHALSLPGKIAPKTAGEILGHVLIDAVKEWKNERGL
ncbi:dipicolinate synthase subunit DpsA [Domibacillus sp. A3M-37]|uniref:dipicolinate synthase subunit DpsA n=1 Tax=Domibacillus sp. A3M-37 TaxID=2962037 RepID=UPI0020B8ABA3|nr:dipicolinate synthase subunit DpsA [Domibacillus sp. A3M-37]MCP3762039.1 dipicolinate synthase subunit DpsA [Domibacillus sp. A3M-37]